MISKPTTTQMTRFVEAMRIFADGQPAHQPIGEHDRVFLATLIGSGLSPEDAVQHMQGHATLH